MKLDRLVARLIFFFFVIDVTFIVLHVCFGWSVINLDEEGNL